MKKMTKTLFAIVALAFVAGCAARPDLNAIRSMPSKGDAFQQALHGEYLVLAKWEEDQGDYDSADYYVMKAKMAAEGKVVAPTEMKERKIPTSAIADLNAARTRLMGALAATASKKAPADAARAQTMFDCWMEQQEENFQPEDIALCRSGFEGAMRNIEAKPAPAPKPAAALPGPFIVYFAHNSAKLDAAAMKVIADAVAAKGASKAGSIVASGHTDLSGTKGYNSGLAKRRAAAVAKAIAAKGVKKDQVRTQSFGQDEPAVKTADGVKEPRNRRVEIRLAK